jgi:tetratricopeptide (TPR) repeat protein
MIIEIRELDEADGTAMLRNRVTSNNSLSDVRRIVNLLHGHPLMLEIIAGQIKCKVAEGDFGYIEKLPSLLEERLKNGSNQGVLGDDPYAIVQGVFNLSYQNMPPKVQRRFRALGILAPDVLVRAHILSATWNDHIDTSTGREESQDYMRTLSQTCMLSQEPDGYTQHALLREYAHALLVREGEEPEVKEHYLGYIVARLAPKFETLPQEQWKLAIDPDLPHIRYVGNLLADNLQSWVNSNQPGENEAVPDWLGDKIASLEALAQPQPPAVLPTLSPGDQAGLTLVQRGADFCAATHKYMFQYYLGDQGRNWLQMGLACARIVEDKKREMLFASVLGSWYANNGQHQVALSYHQAAEHYAQVLKQWADAAVAKNNEAESCRITGQFQKALDLYQQVHKIFTLLGDHEAIAVVSTNLSETCLTLGQIEEASRHAERARRHMDLITDRSRKGDILNALGRIHGAKREFMEALDLYQQALAIHQEVGNRKGEAAAYNNIGLMYDELHELAKAAETYQKSLSISLEIGDRLSEAATRNNIAWVHHQRGDIEQAVDQFNQAIRLCHDMQAVAHESGYLFNLAAVLYRSLPETHDALRLVIQSVALLELHNLPCDATGCPIEKQRAFLARLREEVSSARAENKGKKPSDTTFQFEATDRSKNSVGFFQQMGSLAQESGDQLAAAAALNNEGEMRRVVGDYQQAMKLFQEAFDLFRKNADKKGEATVLNNLGLLYYNLNDLQRALGLYQQALPLRREVGDRAGEAATLNNIGLVYDSAGQSQRALEFYKQALPIRREVNDRGGEATTLHNIGAAYYSLSNLQCALEYYQKALPLRREAGDRPGEATTLFNMAMVHYQGKQFSLAANMFEQAATLYHGLGAFPTEALSLFYVAQTLHSGLRRTSEAIESMLRAIAVFERNNLLQDTAGQMLERYYAHLAAMQSDQRNLHR